MREKPTTAALLVACCVVASVAHATPGDRPAGARVRLPAALASQARTSIVLRYTAYTLPGVTLWSVAPRRTARDAEASTEVVGIDGRGRLVRGPALFQRCSGRPAAALAVCAHDILVHHGGPPLAPGWIAPPISAARAALITAPVVDAGVLTYWSLRGSMSPHLARVRVTVATGVVEEATDDEVARATLPARIEAVVQLTPPRTGYTHMEIVPTATGLDVFSCITSSVEAGCSRRRRPQTLGAADRAELQRLWSLAHGPAACSIGYPSSAPTFRISASADVLSGRLLGESAQRQGGNDPCFVPGQIAWWVVGVHDRPNP